MKTFSCPTCSQTIYVDDGDFEFVSGMKIHHCNGYLYTSQNGREVNLACMILGLSAGTMIDHKDGDSHNTQRSNIRPCTSLENMRNKGAQRNSKTGYKGVFLSPGSRLLPYRAQIKVGDLRLSLGRFKTAEAAASAYNKAAITHFGDFAKLNVIEMKVH